MMDTLTATYIARYDCVQVAWHVQTSWCSETQCTHAQNKLPSFPALSLLQVVFDRLQYAKME